MRTLAIDLGSRRVGLAMGDDESKIATPYDVIEVSTPDQATHRVLEIIKSESIDRILLGLPLNMDDTHGPAAQQTIKWGTDLAKQSNKPVLFIDERLSTFDAEQSLIARKRAGEKLTRKRKKQQQDALAAASFLQAFLDGKLSPIQVE